MRIQIKAHPKSKKEDVRKISENSFEIWVREAPSDGKANSAVLEALAEHLGIAKSKLRIVGGTSSRNKWVEI